MIENFDEALAAALIESGFTEIRRVEDHVEVRRPESFHPYIQFLCKDCKHYNGEDRDICCPLADYAQSKCGADWFCADGERK